MTATDTAAEMTLLLVDDDKPFLTRLARAMEARGFEVMAAETVAEGIANLRRSPPAFAVVDLRLGDGSGLDVIAALHQARPDARAIVLTGYGNIATAVTAVKLGAIDYLAKPADADAVYGALMAQAAEQRAALPENPMSAEDGQEADEPTHPRVGGQGCEMAHGGAAAGFGQSGIGDNGCGHLGKLHALGYRKRPEGKPFSGMRPGHTRPQNAAFLV